MTTEEKPLHALIADDDPQIRMLVQAVLESEGFTVQATEDGKACISAIEKAPRPLPYSLIILDVMMPGMHGLDVLTRLKLKPETAKIPVIMLTAEKTPGDVLAGYTQGAEYYITKPFTRQQLVYGINLVLGRTA